MIIDNITACVNMRVGIKSWHIYIYFLQDWWIMTKHGNIKMEVLGALGCINNTD